MRLHFERLRPWHLPMLVLARALGWKVGAFDHDLGLRRTPVVGGFVRDGSVSRLVTWSWGKSHSDAIGWAERIVDREREHPAIRAMVKLYGDEDVVLVFKRCLAERLSQSFEIGERYRRDIALGQMKPTWLVAGRLAADQRMLRRHGYIGEMLPQGVRLLRFPGVLPALARMAMVAGVVASAALRVLTQVRRAPPPKPPSYPIGWSISTVFQTRFKGPRRFDFIIDDRLIRSQDVVYLLELALPEATRTEMAETGRHVADVTSAGSLGFFRRNNASGPWCGCVLSSLPAALLHGWRKAHIAEGTQVCLAACLRWNALLALVHFRRYVTTNNENRAQIAANVILRRAGIETVAYSQFIGGPYQLTAPFDERHTIWSFLNYDVHAINNAAMRDSFRAHAQAVRRYELIGNVFAELIDARRRVSSAPSDRARTIAVFDTTFVDEPGFFTNYEDAELLLTDLIRLAEARPDLRFLFKPAKPDSYFVDTAAVWASPVAGARVVALRAAYAACPNVEVLGHEHDPVDVIAASALVITHCFSSPTADALAAGVPAIWYASTEKLAGYPLASLAGSAVFGYDALAAGLDELLSGQGICWSDARFETMIEPHGDRKALHRLCLLLAERQGDGATDQRNGSGTAAVAVDGPRQAAGR